MNWRAFFRGMGSVLDIFPAPKSSKPISVEGAEGVEDAWRKTGNHLRKSMGLPEQNKAWLIDEDGTKHYHDIDLTHEGETHGEVKTRLGGSNADWRVYKFAGRKDGYLIYREDFDNQHECGDCGWVGGPANFCPDCGGSFVKHWSWWHSN